MSQQINLYEERLRPRREVLTGRNLGVAALIVLAAVAGVFAWADRRAAQASATAAQLQAQLTAQQEQLATLAKMVSERRVSAALAAELNQSKELLAVRTAVIKLLESGQQGSMTGFSEIFAGFARQASASSNLWLTGFSVTRGGAEVEIRGRSLDASVLPSYVQRLGNEPAFQGRRFSGLEMLDRDLKSEKNDNAPAQSAPGGPSDETAAALPRFVEFTLSSEGAVDGLQGAKASGGRGK